jgi:cob(I)alamin adenosyltransferase
VVGLSQAEAVPPVVLAYLNRLSDLLFMLARLENHRSGAGDVEWNKP